MNFFFFWGLNSFAAHSYNCGGVFDDIDLILTNLLKQEGKSMTPIRSFCFMNVNRMKKFLHLGHGIVDFLLWNGNLLSNQSFCSN